LLHVDSSKDVILFSTADWDTPYWTNKQHTAKHLAQMGYRVLYVETVGLRTPKLGSSRDLGRLWRRLKLGLKGPRRVENGIWVLAPLVVPIKHHWPLLRCLNKQLLTLFIQLFMKKNNFSEPIIWTYHPYILGAIQSINHGKVVFHCVDDLSAVPGVNIQAYKLEEKSLLKQCAVVFTTSEALTVQCAKYNDNVHFLPNVVDYEHFSSARSVAELPTDLRCIPEPRVGYIGVLSDFKVDFDLIYAVATQKKEWHWVLIGEEREGQSSDKVRKLELLPNVHFLGYKRYQELPHYLSGMAVVTLPSIINDYTRSMFPMKYFEYLAAGLRVVGTPLEFSKHYKNGIEIAASTEQFIDALGRQLTLGPLSEDESLMYVGDNTWDKRMIKMWTLIVK
jgi:glycosyltransferase involved in cell wall biosynthesis